MLPLDVLQYMYLPCSKHVSCKNLVTDKSPPLISSAMKLGTCNVSEVVSMDAEKVPQLQYLLNSPTLGHSIPSACFYLQGLDDGGLPLFLVRCGGSVEGQVKRNEDISTVEYSRRMVPLGGRLYYIHVLLCL